MEIYSHKTKVVTKRQYITHHNNKFICIAIYLEKYLTEDYLEIKDLQITTLFTYI